MAPNNGSTYYHHLKQVLGKCHYRLWNNTLLNFKHLTSLLTHNSFVGVVNVNETLLKGVNKNVHLFYSLTWRRHQMETFSALLAIWAGNSPVTVEFPAIRPVTRSFNDFFDLRLNKRMSEQWWSWWFETPSCPLWRHCNEGCGQLVVIYVSIIDVGLYSLSGRTSCRKFSWRLEVARFRV